MGGREEKELERKRKIKRGRKIKGIEGEEENIRLKK